MIELANGGDGYIPPPEQHLFGGYNTWAARSAGLEVSAAPKIVEACIDLLEQVTGLARRDTTLSRGPAAEAIAALKPAAWYRLDEFAGPRAVDSSGNRRDAIYERAVTYYLEGPHSHRFCEHGQTNRAAMFVGGRLRTHLPSASSMYSVSLWLWNGMPDDSRDPTSWPTSILAVISAVTSCFSFRLVLVSFRDGFLALQVLDAMAYEIHPLVLTEVPLVSKSANADGPRGSVPPVNTLHCR